ncbi:hypothetical protein SAY87_021954 [Trapa incisa]|uniref:Uncharacterized protein n=1 Tax=Trapa incisa TaxID=236973 RepID=A0AAN7JSE1_9MYRT|nr:hypothetical protein SAY87_021954 [Trapa incisa]
MMWRSVLCSPPLMELSEKMLKLCFYGASAAFCSIVYTTIAAFFALVGGTLGAMVGSLIGLKAERRFLQRAALGTIAGVFFSVELFKISVGFFLPDGNRFCLFGPMFDSASVRVAQKLVQEWHDPAATASVDVSVEHVQEPKDSNKKTLKTRISREDMIDASGNRSCCPICLQPTAWARHNILSGRAGQVENLIRTWLHGCSIGQGFLLVCGGGVRGGICGAESMLGPGTGRCCGYHKRPESRTSS